MSVELSPDLTPEVPPTIEAVVQVFHATSANLLTTASKFWRLPTSRRAVYLETAGNNLIEEFKNASNFVATSEDWALEDKQRIVRSLMINDDIKRSTSLNKIMGSKIINPYEIAEIADLFTELQEEVEAEEDLKIDVENWLEETQKRYKAGVGSDIFNLQNAAADTTKGRRIARAEANAKDPLLYAGLALGGMAVAYWLGEKEGRKA